MAIFSIRQLEMETIECERSQYLAGVMEKVVHNFSSYTHYTGISCFIALCFTVLCFIVLHRYCVFYKLKVCGHPVLSKSIGTIFPMAFAHFVSLCHVLVILAIFQPFSLLLYLVICDE